MVATAEAARGPFSSTRLRQSPVVKAAVHPALWLLLPSLILPLIIIGIPIYDLLSTSLFKLGRFGNVGEFIWLGNFETVFDDPLFVAAMWRTLVWTIGVVGGTILVSMPVALVLSEDFYGRGVARIIIMLPWAVSLALTAVIWQWTLHGQLGLLNGTLRMLGLQDTPIEWLATAGSAFPIQILIGILVSIPFTTTIFLGGLSSIPRDIYEAAVVDGSNPPQRFRYLTLPLMRPFLNLAIVLNVIYVFNSFPIIWVMTRGGPANGTEILVTYVYKQAFVFGNFAKAIAGSVVMFLLLAAFTILYLWMMAHREADASAIRD